MRNILGWGAASLLGSVAWWLGGHINFAMAVILSTVASAYGLYLGFRWFDQNLK